MTAGDAMRETDAVSGGWGWNPWTGERLTDERCWACGEPVVGEGRVVDAASPKLVHDNERCRRALVPQQPPTPESDVTNP